MSNEYKARIMMLVVMIEGRESLKMEGCEGGLVKNGRGKRRRKRRMN